VLTFDSGQVFLGRRDGSAVTLTRRSNHQYSGSWIVTETIVGTFEGNILNALYRYEECQVGNPSNCPGRCRIQANMSARPQ
jgi:hypothetical protein